MIPVARKKESYNIFRLDFNPMIQSTIQDIDRIGVFENQTFTTASELRRRENIENRLTVIPLPPSTGLEHHSRSSHPVVA